MPVGTFPLTSGNSDTDASSYATASITPSANRLVLVAVYSRVASGTANAPTLSGNNLTWEQVNTQVHATTRRLTVLRSLGSAPTTGAITIDFGGQTQEFCQWSVVESNEVDTTGSNGAGAVVQSVADLSAGSQSSLTVPLAAFSSANNATYGAFGNTQNNGNDPGTGFTELHEVLGANPLRTLSVEWRADNDTTVDSSVTGGGTANWAGIAVEIKFASAAQTLIPTGIASGEAFGTATITTGAVTVSPTAIASAEAFGNANLSSNVIVPNGIPSEQIFGMPTLTFVPIQPSGFADEESIGSEESFGVLTISKGALSVLSPTKVRLIHAGVVKAEVA